MFISKKILYVIFLLGCCFNICVLDIRAFDYGIGSQHVLDIEDKTDAVYKDVIYGEWKITEYISTALANPGILSVIPTENGRSREVGTHFSVEEDYFKYGENEKEEIVLFCNILPISYETEQIVFLPNGMTMKELNVDGDYFIYLEAEGKEISIQFIIQDGNHLILVYLNEIYFCECVDKEENIEKGNFMKISIADSQTSYCSLFEHEWRVVKCISYQNKKTDNEGKYREYLEFSHGMDGNVWITVNREYRVKASARISFINNELGKGEVKGYGTFDELDLNGTLITYVSFDASGTDAEWIKGMFIISEDKILVHGENNLYCCERVTERIKPEDIMLR